MGGWPIEAIATLEPVAGPLHYRAFRRALLARAVGTAGNWMQAVAAGWLVYDITRSAAAVGVLTVLSRTPSILLSTFGGGLADRYPLRPLVLVLYAAQILPTAAVAVLVWDGATTPYAVYAATLCVGIGGALATPLVQRVLTSTVPHGLEERATGLGSVSFNMARLIGPAIGGLLVVAVGPGICFALNALSFLVAFALLRSLPRNREESLGRKAPLAVHSAVHAAVAVPLLRMLFGATIVFSLVVVPVQELSPAIAKRHGDGAHLLGFLLAALAIGGFVGNYARGRLERHGVGRPTLIGGGLVCAGAALAVLGMTTSYVVALAAMFLCGAAWEVIFVICLTGVQFADPRGGGVMVGLFFAVSMAGITAGALLVGAAFDVVGIRSSLLGCAVAAVLAGLLVVARGPVAATA